MHCYSLKNRQSRSVSGRLVSPEFITALTGLYFFIPVCVQCILFVRIYAVYPPRTISRPLFVAIYGTLGAMTLARIANISVALKRISDASRLSPDSWAVTTVGRHVPSVTAELSMSLVYDTYVFSLCLRDGTRVLCHWTASLHLCFSSVFTKAVR